MGGRRLKGDDHMDLQKAADAARELRSAKLAEAESVLVAAATGGEGGKSRPLTDDETRKYEGLLEEAAKAGAEEARYNKLIQEKAALAASEGRRSAPTPAPGIVAPAPKTEVRTLRRFGSLRSFRGPDAQDRAYAAGQWCLAILGGDQRAAQWCADNGIETRALQTTSNNLGGFLVPEQMETAIIDLREERGVARRVLRIRPMQSDTLIVPRRQSGVTAYFVSENSEITASDKGWDTVSLTARKLAVLTKYSSELNEDSVISIADDLAQEIAYAFADKEDECLFNGDGTSTYGGIVGLKNALGDGSEVTAITGNTAFSTLDLEDFEAMVGKLPQFAVNGARWYISRVGWANSMLRLAEAAGGNTVAQIAGGAPLQFLGFPVEIVQVMNSTTTAQTSTDGIAYLGNLDLAASMGSRRGISIAVDGSRYFEFDQLAIRGTERFDINVHEKGTASVAGPVIMLKTPGS
jgi:HK97 family phage major capsid protein